MIASKTSKDIDFINLEAKEQKMAETSEKARATIQGATDYIFFEDEKSGHGDYTKERHAIFDRMSVDDIFAEMKEAV